MFLIFLILGGPDPKIEGGPGPPWPPPYYPPGLELDLKTNKMEVTPFTILENMYGQNTHSVTDQLSVSRGVSRPTLKTTF